MSDGPPYRVVLVNRGRETLMVDANQTVLEAAKAAGIALPSGCCYGACLTCAAQLLWGRVHMSEGNSVPEDLLEQGVFLPCVTTVESECEILVGQPGKPLLPRRIKPWTE